MTVLKVQHFKSFKKYLESFHSNSFTLFFLSFHSFSFFFFKVAQLCPTLCDRINYKVHGILQARILEWVVFPSPGDHPNSGIKTRSPALQADSLPAETQGKPKNTGVVAYPFSRGSPQPRNQTRVFIHLLKSQRFESSLLRNL